MKIPKNQPRQVKQQQVEELTKEIKAMEKRNYDLQYKMMECAQSTKGINDQLLAMQQEREKYLKKMEAQKLLIDRFQKEIELMEAAIPAAGSRKEGDLTATTTAALEKKL